MTELNTAGTFKLGDRHVRRLGYGAMQLAGPHVWGPPKDRAAAVAVLREAVAAGVDHIDTADTYGPHVVNEIIHQALHPYPDDLVLVSKVGAVRGPDASWVRADSAAELEAQVHANLRLLGLDHLEVLNLRLMPTDGGMGVGEGPIEAAFTALAELQQRGLVRHLGLSNVTTAHVEEARRIAPVACVQNLYNLAHREDDAMIDGLAADGIAFTPFFPLGGFSPLQSDALSALARELEVTPMQVALAWLLHRSPNILLIPGTSSTGHLHENLAAARLQLTADALARLGAIGAAAA